MLFVQQLSYFCSSCSDACELRRTAEFLWDPVSKTVSSRSDLWRVQPETPSAAEGSILPPELVPAACSLVAGASDNTQPLWNTLTSILRLVNTSMSRDLKHRGLLYDHIKLKWLTTLIGCWDDPVSNVHYFYQSVTIPVSVLLVWSHYIWFYHGIFPVTHCYCLSLQSVRS